MKTSSYIVIFLILFGSLVYLTIITDTFVKLKRDYDGKINILNDSIDKLNNIIRIKDNIIRIKDSITKQHMSRCYMIDSIQVSYDKYGNMKFNSIRDLTFNIE